MNSKFKIIGSIGTFNTTLKIVNINVAIKLTVKNDYNLYIFEPQNSNLFFCKILITEDKNAVCDDVVYSKDFSIFSYLKTLTLPFKIQDICIINNKVWGFGQDSYIFFDQHESIQKLTDRDADPNQMDIFFMHDARDSPIKISNEKHWGPYKSLFCVNSIQENNCTVACYQDICQTKWCLSVFQLEEEYKSETVLVHFPVTFQKFSKEIFKSDKQPVIVIFPVNSLSILQNLLSANNSGDASSICLIGHPEGKVLFFTCKIYEHNTGSELPLEILCDIKQPVVGIYCMERILSCKDGFLAIVGAYGKIVFISSCKSFNNSYFMKSGKTSYWMMTLHLSSHVQNHIVFNDFFAHSNSSGDFWASHFTEILNSSGQKVLKFATNSVAMYHVSNLVLLSKEACLFLVLTSSGSSYICEYNKKNDIVNLHATLPVLMNEILYESQVLDKLTAIQNMQSRFFASLSAFSSLKFKDKSYINPLCSAIELKGPPRRLLISIDLENLNILKLDTDFWSVTASVYNYLHKNRRFITKSMPFKGNNSFSMEIEESFWCQSQSLLPLFLEVNLVLDLPEYSRSLNCFKLVSEKLPLILRFGTCTLSELHLLKAINKTSKDWDIIFNQNSFQGVNDSFMSFSKINLRNPILHLLPRIDKALSSFNTLDSHGNKNEIQSIKKFSFCLLISNLSEEIKDSKTDNDKTTQFLKILAANSNITKFYEDAILVNLSQDTSITITCQNNNIYITVSANNCVSSLGLRIALLEFFLNSKSNVQQQLKCITIPASVNRKCEELSKQLLNMYGRDTNALEFNISALKLYYKLRKEVSEILPY